MNCVNHEYYNYCKLKYFESLCIIPTLSIPLPIISEDIHLVAYPEQDEVTFPWKDLIVRLMLFVVENKCGTEG